MYASLETVVDYFGNFRDMSLIDKRLDRIGAKSFAQTGTYITIKWYKKHEDGTSKYRQGITLSNLSAKFLIRERMICLVYCEQSFLNVPH